MASIVLSLDKGLTVSKMQVKLDEVLSDNELVVRADGLYVSGKGLWNLKLKDKQLGHGVHVNASPWGLSWLSTNELFDNHVCCDCTVHRLWTAKFNKPDAEKEFDKDPILLYGKNEKDIFRSDADWVLPGDFFRIKTSNDDAETPTYDYYLITEVSTGPTSTYSYCHHCRQRIFPFEGYSDYGNPKWHYTKEKNPHYKIDNPDWEDKGDTEYNAPEICPDCGQPILSIPEQKADELIGLPGNAPTAWVKVLSGAGDF
jgi:hypothetical protein